MTTTAPRIIPTLRYRDARAAMDFLEAAFGFTRGLVVDGPNGLVMHAQLTLDGGMIMIGSARDDAFGQIQKPPGDLGGAVTQSAYIIVDDVDAHHGRAVAAGAVVTEPLSSPEHGGRFYGCRDLEGHVWSFGSYDPWAE